MARHVEQGVWVWQGVWSRGVGVVGGVEQGVLAVGCDFTNQI